MAKYTGPIVDIDIHNRPASDADLAKYLPKEWREYGEARLRHGASVASRPTGLDRNHRRSRTTARCISGR